MAGTLYERAKLGEVLRDELIIDAHAHMGPWYNFHIPANDAAGMVACLNAAGIDTIVSAPHNSIGPDYRAGNEEVYAAARQFPGRIVPYVTVNPKYPQEEIEAEIARWEQAGGIKAFKIHPSIHQTKADHESYRPVWEYANAHGLPLLAHSWNACAHASPQMLGKLADEYPQVSVLVGHSATNWDMIDLACEEANKRENLYLDLTGSGLHFRGLETMVERAGAEKILFGTDIPFIDPRPGLGRALFARIGDEEKRMILGGNARRVFGI